MMQRYKFPIESKNLPLIYRVSQYCFSWIFRFMLHVAIFYLFDFILLNLLNHLLDILTDLYKVLVKDSLPFIP